MKSVWIFIMITIGGVPTPGGTTDETFGWAPRLQPSMEVCLKRQASVYRTWRAPNAFKVWCEYKPHGWRPSNLVEEPNE